MAPNPLVPYPPAGGVMPPYSGATYPPPYGGSVAVAL